MSILEMLITMGMVGFVAAGALGILVAAKGIWQANQARSEVRQGLQLATWQIDNELRLTNEAFVTDNTAEDPAAFSFPSAFDRSGRFATEADGVADWQKFVIYYIPTGSQDLLRKEVFAIPTDPEAAPELTSAQLAGYCDGTGKLVASGVTALGLTLDSEHSSAQLRLTVEARSGQGDLERQSRTFTVRMRN